MLWSNWAVESGTKKLDINSCIEVLTATALETSSSFLQCQWTISLFYAACLNELYTTIVRVHLLSMFLCMFSLWSTSTKFLDQRTQESNDFRGKNNGLDATGFMFFNQNSKDFAVNSLILFAIDFLFLSYWNFFSLWALHSQHGPLCSSLPRLEWKDVHLWQDKACSRPPHWTF
jgi:hypothetical protein